MDYPLPDVAPRLQRTRAARSVSETRPRGARAGDRSWRSSSSLGPRGTVLDVSQAASSRARIPSSLAWLFPEIDVRRIDAHRDENLVLTRVLERGRMSDVEWCIRHYGLEGIRGFFRAASHPEISRRTVRFWAIVLDEDENTWPSAPSFRQASAALWPG